MKQGTPAKPTVEQLALLAATLSKSKLGERVEPPESLVSRAMAIWKAADELLARPQPQHPTAPERPNWQEPKEEDYPVTMDEFLRLMLPGKRGRPSDRYPILRNYLIYRLRHPEPNPLERATPLNVKIIRDQKRTLDCCDPRIDPRTSKLYPWGSLPALPEPTEDYVIQRMDFWRANPIPDHESFCSYAFKFRPWYDESIIEKRRAAAWKSHASPKRDKRKGHPASGKQDGRKGARPPRERLRQALEIEKPLA